MEYLIDTHVLIWYIEGDRALPPHLIKVLDDNKTTIIVSIASLWEITIKVSLGKLTLFISIQQLHERIGNSRNF